MSVFVVHLLKQFLPLAVAITVICATVYLAVQQDIRLSANDPQIQFAEQTAQNLNYTRQDQFRSPQHKLDIATSLGTFTMIFGKNGNPVYSPVQLDNNIPSIPQGVFVNVAQHGENRFTWQPKNGVRIAAVMVSYRNGFVLVGRNMREVEKREDDILLDVGCGWIAGLVVTFFTVLGLQVLFNRKKYR